MAISFAHLAPLRLTKGGGAVRKIAYTARAALEGFDYSHLRGDLAHEEILLPDHCPPDFLNRHKLASALDEAEHRKVRTPLADRSRLPQVGLELVMALPASDEVSGDEAAEIVRRIVIAVCGSQSIPIHIAIHEAKINRHAHVIFGLRPVDHQGALGPKLRDFVVLHRRTGLEAKCADVVEGINWPALTWELQQAYFSELGIDLVVDPIAPVSGKHFSPFVFSRGKVDSNKADEEIASALEKGHAANISAIEGSPTHLVETILRGRSSLRIAEIERLCAKFYDSRHDQSEKLERILLDQNVVTMTDAAGAHTPRYATTRRLHRLVTRAAGLVDLPGEIQIKTFTGIDEDSVLGQIADSCAAAAGRGSPLILGAKLSDCSTAKVSLADYEPIIGTIDMAITGSQELRAVGRKRGVCLRPDLLVIVPHAELIDDQRLARLMIATKRARSALVLGHHQSSQTGVVCRHLAAHAADKVTRARSFADGGTAAGDVVSLLRAGLVRQAIEEMANKGLLKFGTEPRPTEEASSFIVCDDPHRIKELHQKVRLDRVQSGSISEPVLLTTLGHDLEFSVGEWIIAEEPAGINRIFRKVEFGRVVAIDAVEAIVDIVISGESKRIDLKSGPIVRPAAALSIREAHRLFAEANLAVEATDPRRLWSALLLVAMRGQNARLHVDPKLADSKAALIEVVRRSLPGALPHQREVREDPNAAVGRIILQMQNGLEILPDTTPVDVKPPRAINAPEEVRRLLANDGMAREGYTLLFNYVAAHNPDHVANTERALQFYRGDELMLTIIRFLAGVEQNSPRDPDLPLDLPLGLDELKQQRWTLWEVHRLGQELGLLTLPYTNNPIRSSSDFSARKPSGSRNGRRPPLRR